MPCFSRRVTYSVLVVPAVVESPQLMRLKLFCRNLCFKFHYATPQGLEKDGIRLDLQN